MPKQYFMTACKDLLQIFSSSAPFIPVVALWIAGPSNALVRADTVVSAGGGAVTSDAF